ncbi:hypothetical protein ACPPVU_21570 [Mucilaginibacter sp. McL0603]|uniref:hypothetical protein n=1 Tax=Mucilaginibacter sp. McL0603 TaxID=3415670 RepID=UPI003CF94AC0
MKKILLTLCPLLLFICVAKAQVQEQNPTDLSKKFFEIYAAKPMDAIDYLFSDVKKIRQVNDDITAIKKNLKMTIDQGGVNNGYELITEKNIGNNFKLQSYMVKYDKQPVRFIFIYYRPKDAWKIYTFQFNTNMDEELTSAATVDQLKENK